MDAVRLSVGKLGENDAKDGGVFDRLGGALGQVGEGWVAGVADEGYGAVDPGSTEGLVKKTWEGRGGREEVWHG